MRWMLLILLLRVFSSFLYCIRLQHQAESLAQPTINCPHNPLKIAVGTCPSPLVVFPQRILIGSHIIGLKAPHSLTPCGFPDCSQSVPSAWKAFPPSLWVASGCPSFSSGITLQTWLSGAQTGPDALVEGGLPRLLLRAVFLFLS